MHRPRPIKAQADWICRTFTTERMTAVGVVMIDISFGFLVYMPFSGEKAGVYLMSFLALLFAGIICVAEGARAQKGD